jgi:hypothetical protein
MSSLFQKVSTCLGLIGLLLLTASCAPKASTTGKQEPKKPAVTKDNSFIDLKVFESATKEVTLKSMASNKNVTVFQFSGVTCKECMETSPVIRAGVDELGSQAQVVVLFPNPKSAFATTKEYLNFINKYSKNSRFAVDDTRIVQKTIRSSDEDFFGMYMVVKKDGTSVVFPTSNTDPDKVLAAVKKALEKK